MSEIALGIATAISLAMAAMLGVFLPRRIKGPERLEEGEPATTLLSIAGMGLFAWGAASLLAGEVSSRQGQSGLTDVQQVLFNGGVELAGAAGNGCRDPGNPPAGNPPARDRPQPVSDRPGRRHHFRRGGLAADLLG